MVDAAYHVGHAHVVVVDHHGEIVGRVAVRAQDDQIVEVFVGKHHAALHGVLDHGFALARGLEPDRERGTLGCFARIAVAPRADDRQRPLFRFGGGPHGVKLVLGQIAAVGPAGRQHGLGHLAVAGCAFELRDGLTVPVQFEPFQPRLKRRDSFRMIALPVGIFDPQKEPATPAFGIQPVEQRRPCAADMEISGGRWRKTDNGLRGSGTGHWRSTYFQKMGVKTVGGM
jgi:hypothetical protein